MAKVVFDKEQQVIKVDSACAKVTGKCGASILYAYGKFNFHPRAVEVLSKVDLLKFRTDDVLLTMFPKSGSTWLSECIYLIVNSYSYEKASKESIEYRFPQIDSPSHDVFGMIVDQYDNTSIRRMIKASIPATLLVDRSGQDCAADDNNNNRDVAITKPSAIARPLVIAIFRNPRDVLVSFYHHCKTVKHYDVDITFNEFFDNFVAGKVPCGPIWLMYNEMYKYYAENPKTCMYILYEDMKTNLRAQIRRICKFLMKPEPQSEQEWSQFLDHLSVDRMRQNRTINRHDWDKLGLRNPKGFEFVRKGQVNDWKNFFSEQQSIIFDEMVTSKLSPELQKIYGPQKY